jgi:hypothetical protein
MATESKQAFSTCRAAGRQNGKRALSEKRRVILLSLFLLVIGISAFPIFIVSPVKADGPYKGVFGSRFFVPDQEIVSCSNPSARSRCADGTCSTSTGPGTCSHHGGVVGSVNNTDSTTPEEPIASNPPVEPPSVHDTSSGVSEQAPPEDVAIPQSGGILESETSAALLLLNLSTVLLLVFGAVQEVYKG